MKPIQSITAEKVRKNCQSRAKRITALVGAACILSLVVPTTTSRAAPITWGPATNIATTAVETDVLNTGAVIGAFNLGTTSVPSTTVNGVTFASFAVTDASNTVGNFTITRTGTLYSTNTAFGSTATPFASLTSPYQTLLQSGTAVDAGQITLTMSGLTIGQDYAFQWWSNDSGPEFFPYSTTATAVNTVALNDNTSGHVTGGLGTYAIGTFTADSTSEVIVFSGSVETPLLNAFQLQSVPEPATLSLFALAAPLLLTRRRRNT